MSVGHTAGLWAACLAAASTAAAGPRFQDLTATLPVSHVYAGGWEHFVGGGIAVFDCDDDGYPDLYAAGGENPARLFRNATPPGGALAFELSEAPEVGLTAVTGAYPLDIDGDGHLDLFVLRAGPNAVLRGLGDCRFEEAADHWGIDPGGAWTTAFAAIWEAGRDWPMLAVGNYVDRDDPEGPFETCEAHQLLRPKEQGYDAPEEIAPAYCALSMLFLDWAGDGRTALWISNDRHYYVRGGQEQLFEITPDLRDFGTEDGWRRHMLWGMGLAARDLTGDGRPEIAVTSMADQYLFELEPGAEGPSYGQTAFQRGTTAHIPYAGEEGRPSTGWHVAFGDVDNDGLDDLFIAKGNVEQMPGSAMRDPDNLLMQNTDGTFAEAGGEAGIGSPDRSRGAALTDLDRDGRLDLVVVQRGTPMRLYRNVTEPSGNWLKLRLTQARGNRDAVGARIELRFNDRTQVREVQVGGGHAGGHLGYQHFGLGDATSARLRIRWPDGRTGAWSDVGVDLHLVVARGAADDAILAEE